MDNSIPVGLMGVTAHEWVGVMASEDLVTLIKDILGLSGFAMVRHLAMSKLPQICQAIHP